MQRLAESVPVMYSAALAGMPPEQQSDLALKWSMPLVEACGP